MSNLIPLAFTVGLAAAAGYALFLVKDVASSVTSASTSGTRCDKGNHYDASNVFVDITEVAGKPPTVEPLNCFVNPGQRVIFRFYDLDAVNLRFGTQSGVGTSQATPDENFGSVFDAKYATGKDKRFSIVAGPDNGACQSYPYFVVGNGGQIEPNPAIIIKPTNATAPCPNEPS